jgi:hypothetical protein
MPSRLFMHGNWTVTDMLEPIPKVIRRLPPAQCDFGSIGLFDSIWRPL